MIAGIGTDLVEIERIRKACEKEAFFLRVFTETERKQITKPESFAGCFAAKEAAAKALGPGFRNFELQDLWVDHDQAGAPRLHFERGAARQMERIGAKRCFLTISHEKAYAVATVILETAREVQV